jgi:histone-binding protein RBBP4
LSWNGNNEWFVASVADNNMLQVWQLAANIYDDDSVEAEELE